RQNPVKKIAKSSFRHEAKMKEEEQKQFVVPLLLTITASSYSAAEDIAHSIAADTPFPPEIKASRVETYFEYDNANQRVLYLHPIEESADAAEEGKKLDE